MTREEFENAYECPWKIGDKYLDDYEDIFRDAYKPMMLGCKTIPEMMKVARQFGCFTWGGTLQSLNKMSNFYVEPLHDMFLGKDEPQEYELALVSPILLPRVMLNAFLIASRYDLPQFYAGLQYIRAVNYREKTDA